jgi:hypothetical protein
VPTPSPSPGAADTEAAPAPPVYDQAVDPDPDPEPASDVEPGADPDPDAVAWEVGEPVWADVDDTMPAVPDDTRIDEDRTAIDPLVAEQDEAIEASRRRFRRH